MTYNSKAVIEWLIQLRNKFPQTVFICGNYDQILLDALVELGVMATDRLRYISLKYKGKMHPIRTIKN